MNPVSYRPEAGIAWITIDYPPVNAMSLAVRDGLLKAVRAAEADNHTRGIILCAGRTFVAGGDISEFGHPPQEPHLPDVYNVLEASQITWLAAMHGTVLGGGLELAMACDFRIADPNTRFGLPEVSLGLVPGAGGTQRIPRLVGVELAVDLTTSGRMIKAPEFLQAGGLDRLVEGDLATAAIEFMNTAGDAPQRVSERQIAPISDDYFTSQKPKVVKAAKGAAAPLHNLDAVQWATQTPFNEGQPRERALHLQLRDSEQSVALRHAFFAERAVSKPKILTGSNARDFSHITIVGGGLMGTGIAAACLNAGLQVHILEVDDAAASAAQQRTGKLLEGALQRGKISQQQFDEQGAGLTSGTDYRAAAKTDIAIEAVVEDLQVKRKVFQSLAQHMSSEAIIATNTSYINPLEISEGVSNPSRIVGLHFFSPAHIMKLLEIINTPDTSGEVLATAFAFAKKLRKIGALSGICDGFIGNRMLAAYRRQSDYLLADGATPQQIDSAIRDFGLPMGPYELQDLTGLQIGWANRKRLAPTRDPAQRYIPIADKLCEQGRFGQRSGSGWYRYESGSRTPIADPAVDEIITQWADRQGTQRREFSAQQIQQSLLAVLANEGACILQEGIAERALDIDMVKIHGYGYPRWRGGPMHTAEQLGVDVIKATLAEVTAQSPDSWTIAEIYQ